MGETALFNLKLGKVVHILTEAPIVAPREHEARMWKRTLTRRLPTLC